jgi:hypothetical protein
MSSSTRAMRGTAGRATSRAAVLALALLPLAPLVLVALLVVTLAASSRSGARSRVAAEDVAASAELDRTPTRSAGVGVFGTLRAAPGRLLAGAAAVGVAVILAVTGAAGSFAYYNTQTSVGTYTMSSGSLALTVQYGSGAAGSSAALPTANFQNMLPGDIVGLPVTIASTGTATSTVTARLNAAIPSGWEVRIAPGACPAGQLSTTALTTNPLAYGTFPAGVATSACVQVVLRSDAPAAVANLGFDIVIDATQVQS